VHVGHIEATGTQLLLERFPLLVKDVADDYLGSFLTEHPGFTSTLAASATAD
jgi:hypothetical protein